MYEQSHRDYLRSGYLHHRLPVMGWVNHYRDNAILALQSPARQNASENHEAGERGNSLTCRCVSADVAAPDAKYTKELAGC